jgi:fructose-1,6-bisphosphatase/inositol monophosphatase family enzyme
MVTMISRIPALSPHFDDDILSLQTRVAEQDILPYFQNLKELDIETKSSATDFVTIADRQAERQLISGLKYLLPEAQFVAEENTAQFGLSEALDTGFVWTIDPLDGTRNFVEGNAEFCTMLGLLYDGMPVGAWIYKPLTSESVIARHDGLPRYIDAQGSHRICQPNASDLASTSIHSLKGCLNAMGFDSTIRERVREKLKTLQGRFHIGSAGVEAMSIAAGSCDYLMHSKLTYWDSVPVVMVINSLGYHVRLAPSGANYQPGDKGVLLAAPTTEIWQQLADFVWSA